MRGKSRNLDRRLARLLGSPGVLGLSNKTAEDGGIPSINTFCRRPASTNPDGSKRRPGGPPGHKSHARKRPTPNRPPLEITLEKCPMTGARLPAHHVWFLAMRGGSGGAPGATPSGSDSVSTPSVQGDHCVYPTPGYRRRPRGSTLAEPLRVTSTSELGATIRGAWPPHGFSSRKSPNRPLPSPATLDGIRSWLERLPASVSLSPIPRKI